MCGQQFWETKKEKAEGRGTKGLVLNLSFMGSVLCVFCIGISEFLRWDFETFAVVASLASCTFLPASSPLWVTWASKHCRKKFYQLCATFPSSIGSRTWTFKPKTAWTLIQNWDIVFGVVDEKRVYHHVLSDNVHWIWFISLSHLW